MCDLWESNTTVFSRSYTELLCEMWCLGQFTFMRGVTSNSIIFQPFNSKPCVPKSQIYFPCIRNWTMSRKLAKGFRKHSSFIGQNVSQFHIGQQWLAGSFSAFRWFAQGKVWEIFVILHRLCVQFQLIPALDLHIQMISCEHSTIISFATFMR